MLAAVVFAGVHCGGRFPAVTPVALATMPVAVLAAIARPALTWVHAAIIDGRCGYAGRSTREARIRYRVSFIPSWLATKPSRR